MDDSLPPAADRAPLDTLTHPQGEVWQAGLALVRSARDMGDGKAFKAVVDVMLKLAQQRLAHGKPASADAEETDDDDDTAGPAAPSALVQALRLARVSAAANAG